MVICIVSKIIQGAFFKSRAVTKVVFVRHVENVWARPKLLHWNAMDLVVSPIERLQPDGPTELRNEHPQLLIIFGWHARGEEGSISAFDVVANTPSTFSCLRE